MSDTETSNRRRRSLAALIILALTFWAADFGALPSVSAEQSASAFQTITTEQLAQMLEHKDFLFVNVHVPYEGEITQTDAFIPFDEIDENLSLLPTAKSAPIVLYCRSGRMSEIAAGELAARGYTNISHMAGGMVEWAKAGHPVLGK